MIFPDNIATVLADLQSRLLRLEMNAPDVAKTVANAGAPPGAGALLASGSGGSQTLTGSLAALTGTNLSFTVLGAAGIAKTVLVIGVANLQTIATSRAGMGALIGVVGSGVAPYQSYAWGTDDGVATVAHTVTSLYTATFLPGAYTAQWSGQNWNTPAGVAYMANWTTEVLQLSW